MVKLVRRVTTRGAAGFPDFLVSFRLLELLVKMHLDGAFYVVAEFSALVLGKALG
jgi:hypothetical protein